MDRMDGISIDTWLMVIVLIAASSGSCCLVVLPRPDVERPFDRTPVRSCTPSTGENPQLLRTGV
jgi:hypothetical protein